MLYEKIINIYIKKKIKIIKIGLYNNIKNIYKQINNNVNFMFKNNIIYEIKKIFFNIKKKKKINCIGYKLICNFFKKKNNLLNIINKIKIYTKKYVKKQII
ncbi:MAG: hypothetical protein ABUS76_00255 [Candidatus Shikimatogenerans sp. Ttur]|uniref:Uncharacterized protein n=1 Tax=Candidatus Shikimatogenerans sp. Ttur TaxID=3158569 RepID=A0AAU7ZXI6_9FLAO